MDNDILEISSDSEMTIIAPVEEGSPALIEDIVKKYQGSNIEQCKLTSHTKQDLKNKYELSDFSDDDITHEPLLKRVKSKSSTSLEKVQSWQNNFEEGDFCEDSNDIFDILQKAGLKQENRNEELDLIKNLRNKYLGTSTSSADSSRSDSQNDSFESPKDVLKKLSEKYSTSNKDTIYQNLALKSSSTLKNTSLHSDDNISSACLNHSKIVSLPERGYAGSREENMTVQIQHYSETEITVINKKRRGKTNVEKEQEKLQKELVKEAKKKEREQKKIQAEMEKARKNALKVIQNSTKPDECLKNIVVNIDNSISSMEYNDELLNALKTLEYNYKYISHDQSEVITWTREIQSVDDAVVNKTNKNENYLLKIMRLPEFLEHIENDSLIANVVSVLTDDKKLILVIVGLQQYYKYVDTGKRNKKDAYDYKNLPKVRRFSVEAKITELQILTKCYFKTVDSYEELSNFILECTKSVAQIPYKLMKQKKQEEENEFFSGENKDCVNVDKHGNGLNRLWNQILTQFPLARLETSEAITSVYPTMFSLFEAYERCTSVEEGERLLQNIPIRRAAGLLTTVRKIGPELSKKIYYFFTSKENMLL